VLGATIPVTGAGAFIVVSTVVVVTLELALVVSAIAPFDVVIVELLFVVVVLFFVVSVVLGWLLVLCAAAGIAKTVSITAAITWRCDMSAYLLRVRVPPPTVDGYLLIIRRYRARDAQNAMFPTALSAA
jgi:hypothetical protein